MTKNLLYTTNVYASGDYTVPRIHVVNETKVIKKQAGKAGIVAIIGAFPNDEKDILSFSSYKSILRYYDVDEGSKAEQNFDGLLAAKQILMAKQSECKGASEVLLCNFTEYTDAGKEYLEKIKSDVRYDGSSVYAELSSYTLTVTTGSDDSTSGTITSDDTTVSTDDTTDDPFVADYYDTTLTYAKLQQALNRLYGETFNILFVADLFQDIVAEHNTTNSTMDSKLYAEYLNIPFEEIRTFLSSEFQLQRPSQLVMGLKTQGETDDSLQSICTQRNTTTTNLATINTVDGICQDEAVSIASEFVDDMFSFGGLYTQRIYVDSNVNSTTGAYEPLSLMESAAYMCGFLACTEVSESLTYKTIPGVISVVEEMYVGPNDTGYVLAEAGLPVIISKVRSDNTYCVMNSYGPSGYDISHVRSVSYLIREYELHEYLGKGNNASTRAAISTDMMAVNQQVMSDVPIIESIDSSDIEVISPNEIYINLEVVVSGILIVINLGVNMVQGDE